jgi:hypothetical protein
MPKKKPNYFQNVANEINDVYQAYRRTTEMSQTSGPGTDAAANRLAKQERKEVGQLVGSIIKGARYNSKGKRVN